MTAIVANFRSCGPFRLSTFSNGSLTCVMNQKIFLTNANLRLRFREICFVPMNSKILLLKPVRSGRSVLVVRLLVGQRTDFIPAPVGRLFCTGHFARWFRPVSNDDRHDHHHTSNYRGDGQLHCWINPRPLNRPSHGRLHYPVRDSADGGNVRVLLSAVAVHRKRG